MQQLKITKTNSLEKMEIGLQNNTSATRRKTHIQAQFGSSKMRATHETFRAKNKNIYRIDRNKIPINLSTLPRTLGEVLTASNSNISDYI